MSPILVLNSQYQSFNYQQIYNIIIIIQMISQQSDIISQLSEQESDDSSERQRTTKSKNYDKNDINDVEYQKNTTLTEETAIQNDLDTQTRYKQYFQEVQSQCEKLIQQSLKDQQSRLQHNIVLLSKKLKFSNQIEISYKNTTIFIIHNNKNGSQIKYLVIIGKYKIELDLLNVDQQSPQKLQKIGSGGFGQIFKIKIDDETIAIKRKYFKTPPIILKSKKQKIVIIANKQEIQQHITQLCIYKICSFYKIGPKLSSKFGYDLICFSDSIEFYMEYCKTQNQFDQKAIKDLKICARIMHKLKIIHKDIKPSNILFSKFRNKFVLSDFGLSHPVKQKIGQLSLSYKEGTVSYMSLPMIKIKRGSKKYIDLYDNDLHSLERSFTQLKRLNKIRQMKQRRQIIIADKRRNTNKIYYSIYLLSLLSKRQVKEMKKILKNLDQQIIISSQFLNIFQKEYLDILFPYQMQLICLENPLLMHSIKKSKPINYQKYQFNKTLSFFIRIYGKTQLLFSKIASIDLNYLKLVLIKTISQADHKLNNSQFMHINYKKMSLLKSQVRQMSKNQVTDVQQINLIGSQYYNLIILYLRNYRLTNQTYQLIQKIKNRWKYTKDKQQKSLLRLLELLIGMKQKKHTINDEILQSLIKQLKSLDIQQRLKFYEVIIVILTQKLAKSYFNYIFFFLMCKDIQNAENYYSKNLCRLLQLFYKLRLGGLNQQKTELNSLIVQTLQLIFSKITPSFNGIQKQYQQYFSHITFITQTQQNLNLQLQFLKKTKCLFGQFDIKVGFILEEIGNLYYKNADLENSQKYFRKASEIYYMLQIFDSFVFSRIKILFIYYVKSDYKNFFQEFYEYVCKSEKIYLFNFQNYTLYSHMNQQEILQTMSQELKKIQKLLKTISFDLQNLKFCQFQSWISNVYQRMELIYIQIDLQRSALKEFIIYIQTKIQLLIIQDLWLQYQTNQLAYRYCLQLLLEIAFKMVHINLIYHTNKIKKENIIYPGLKIKIFLNQVIRNFEYYLQSKQLLDEIITPQFRSRIQNKNEYFDYQSMICLIYQNIQNIIEISFDNKLYYHTIYYIKMLSLQLPFDIKIDQFYGKLSQCYDKINKKEKCNYYKIKQFKCFKQIQKIIQYYIKMHKKKELLILKTQYSIIQLKQSHIDNIYQQFLCEQQKLIKEQDMLIWMNYYKRFQKWNRKMTPLNEPTKSKLIKKKQNYLKLLNKF